MDYSVKSIKSLRESMEDEYSIVVTPNYSIFGVYDGHGGKAASKFCKKEMIPYLEKKLDTIIKKNNNTINKYITNVFADIDTNFKSKKNSLESGTTAVVVIVTDKLIIIANCGDSRCILCDNFSNIIVTTQDHKPSCSVEKHRIERAGGKIKSGRIDNILNLSRAIGDFDLKNNTLLTSYEQKVICVPDIYIFKKKDINSKFLILATDGIWDTFDSQTILDFVYKNYKKGHSLNIIADELIKKCEKSNKCEDNKTIIIVDLDNKK